MDSKPDEAHAECKNIVDFWSSPERHKVKRNHGVFVDEFSECYNPSPMFRRPDVDSLHDILTKIRELKKQGVPNNLIMSVLKEIKPGNQDSKKKSKRHDDSNQKSLLDPPDE